MAQDILEDNDGFWDPPDNPNPGGVTDASGKWYNDDGTPWVPTPSGHMGEGDLVQGPDGQMHDLPWWQNPTAPANNTTTTNTTNTPPPAPPRPPTPPAPAGQNYHANYQPPAFTPSPFVMPNGMVPPGMPFSPDPHAVALQNQALEKALQTPAVTPGTGVDPELMRMQDDLLRRVLQGNPFGSEYMNQLNEQQKEIALARGEAAKRGIMQRAASRGTYAGGTIQGGLRRADDEVSRNVLQSHRDASLQTGQLNNMANQEATKLGESILGGREDRAVGQQALNRNALLDALMASENIYGGRENRGLSVAKFAEAIRQYDQDLLNRQAEFGSSLGFNYDSLNAGSYNNWLNYLANLGR